ncbi:rhomboid family intramembrane serine protease [Streptacidiphilus rugosus]|uniref:rhomboid family intramembrane serine protease n=1 Tax=Streptacidiphilus rugosus TaxID=405783 RepID=UPI000565984F|nr:rhomboid family intramembrane serine protease [Streptacidiphilus rugosus]
MLPDCYRHPGRETGVRCSRCEKPVCPECRVEAAVGFHCLDCFHEGRSSARVAAPRTEYGGQVVRDGALVTKALIAANLVVWLLAFTGGDGFVARWIMQGDAVVLGHQWYRMITSVFLHQNILHIAMNMWSLWVLGPYLEKVLGRMRFLALYLVSGLAGSALVMATDPAKMVLGASGAIFGLLGAVIVIHRHRGYQLGPIIAVLVVNLVATFSLGFIAWQAHIGGLVAGMLIAAGYAYAPADRRNAVQGLGVVLVAALVAGVSLYAAVQIT